VDRIRLGGQ